MHTLLSVLIAIAALLVVGGLFFVGGKLVSIVPDRLRQRDHTTAETLDQLPATLVNPVALPMHDRAFDKPR